MKRIFLALFFALALMLTLVVCVSAATYYVDKNGELTESESDNIAFEFNSNKSSIPCVFLHDTSITSLVFPYIEGLGQIQLQENYTKSLEVYALSDKETKANNLMAQIKEVTVYNNIYLDGAYSTGTFNGYTSLEKLNFYGKVSAAHKGGFFNNASKLVELHFYGKDLAIPGIIINELNTKNEMKIVFHQGSSGTIATGGDTLPEVAKLGDWKIIINTDIKPSNANDTRLGAKWGSITATTGWELIMAVSTFDGVDSEALKTSHGFCSRAVSVDATTVCEATVMTYCQLGYDEHAGSESVVIDDGYLGEIKLMNACTKCNEGVLLDTIAPIFTYRGYSVTEKAIGGVYSVTQGYIVNKDSLDKYLSINPDFKFGLVASGYANPLGQVLDADKVINYPGEKFVYNYFEIKVNGIADGNLSKNIVFCAYVIDNGTVYYIDDNKTTEDVTGISVNTLLGRNKGAE